MNNQAGRKSSIDEAISVMREAGESHKVIHGIDRCLWKPPYDEPTYEARVAFLHDKVFTWNEAERACQQLPTKDYIDYFVWHWHDCKLKGMPLICEKSRRLILSWVGRALECHDAGITPGDYYIAMKNYKDSTEMVWRIWYIYEQVRLRNPAWNLDPCKTKGASLTTKEIENVKLPNGSLFTNINEDGEGVRGSGVSVVCAEELSGYAHPEEMWAQLNIITQGSPVDGISTRGFSYAICNASANEGYDRLTKEKAPPVVDAKKPFAFDPAVYRSWG